MLTIGLAILSGILFLTSLVRQTAQSSQTKPTILVAILHILIDLIGIIFSIILLIINKNVQVAAIFLASFAITRMIQSITSSKIFQKNKSESNLYIQRCEALLSRARELVFDITSDGKITFANTSLLKIFKVESLEQLNSHIPDILSKDQIDRFESDKWKQLNDGKTVTTEFQINIPNIGLHHISVTLVPVVENNKLSCIHGIGRDITSEVKSFDQVQFLASAVSDSDAPIVIYDLTGKIIVWNRGIERLTKISRNQIYDYSYSDLFPDTPDIMLEVAARGGSFRIETILASPEGAIPVRLLAYRIGDKNRALGYSIFLEDLRREKNLEDRVQHFQRMEAVGRLACGVAHDFNNLLTIIAGNTVLLKKVCEEFPAISKQISAILRATKRGANLTNQLLTFSKSKPFNLTRFSLGKMITETEELLRHAGWRLTKIDVKLEPNLPDILADPTRIQQVLMNLCVNGLDAMPDGGTLTISAVSQKIMPDEFGDNQDLLPGSYQVMEVCDTGSGIEASLLDHIFEPFFTTKTSKKGTGLGLATVHGIVQQHKGWIVVDSKVGEGSCFKVHIPVDGPGVTNFELDMDELSSKTDAETTIGNHEQDHFENIEERDSSSRSSRASLSGSENILLIDDEDMIREIYETALNYYGYNVKATSNYKDAMISLEDNLSKIDLYVVDYSMRGKQKSLFQELRNNFPDIPALIISDAWPDTAKSLGKIPQAPLEAQLVKPFLPETMVKEIRNLLDLKE